ncbi:hypothetical protein [Crocinitomix algicola]|uniref:hypothetical protein n=1 Tax=Crocinitomix algicola TaxID=1740263 RepID=UPI00082CB5E5|nr:hypothetical protein [Crocinitomix algicola]
MTQISFENIEKAIQKIDGLNEEALDRKIETFTLKQQALVNYILQAGLEYENEELNMYSIYYFAIIHEAFDIQGITLNEVTEDAIEAFQEPFLLALDAIYKDEDYSPMQDLVQQHHLNQFMMNEIDAVDEDGDSLTDETKTQLFIVASGMIGLMNGAVQK